jgi:hypothetical protein
MKVATTKLVIPIGIMNTPPRTNKSKKSIPIDCFDTGTSAAIRVPSPTRSGWAWAVAVAIATSAKKHPAQSPKQQNVDRMRISETWKTTYISLENLGLELETVYPVHTFIKNEFYRPPLSNPSCTHSQSKSLLFERRYHFKAIRIPGSIRPGQPFQTAHSLQFAHRITQCGLTIDMS